jgi:hypothetical protein
MNSENPNEILPHEKPSILLSPKRSRRCGRAGNLTGPPRVDVHEVRARKKVKKFSLLKGEESRELYLFNFQ